MPFILPCYKSFQHVNPKTSTRVDGLLEFLKSLELAYFSEVILKNKGGQNLEFDLVLEMKCPLSLTDILGHFNKGLWGCNDMSKSTLAKSFENLVSQNYDVSMDIHEVTLFLKDTNIIIKNIYKHSIPEQFNNIITEIAKQYVSLTKGLTEQPEEIFIPVFEDTISSENSGPIHHVEKAPTPSSYKEYWGIYFESEIDGLIFDVKNNRFIPANLDYCILDDNNAN